MYPWLSIFDCYFNVRNHFVNCRIVHIIIEQNFDKDRTMLAKTVKVYAPYWFSIARCPPLTCRLLDTTGKRQSRNPFRSKKNEETILEEITEEEMFEGHTIASAYNFKLMGVAVSIAQSGEEQFGPTKDLSLLSNMVGFR